MSETVTRQHQPARWAIALSAALAATSLWAQDTSKLWGASGESWRANGRLPDFTAGDWVTGDLRDLRSWSSDNEKNVKTDFGAAGNGITDDSDAFIRAIAGTHNGDLYIPPGRYKITKVLLIRKSNIRLRGAGPGKSVLYFPKPLAEVAGEYADLAKVGWQYAGGFVWVEGEQKGKKITSITAPAPAGSTQLKVASTAGINIKDFEFAGGPMLRLVQRDDENHTLVKEMQGGLAFQPDQIDYLTPELGDPRKIQDWLVEVKSVKGNTVTLARPLPIDVKPGWKPSLYKHAPTVHNVDIEGLTFEFSGEAKKAHNKEEGYNGIMFRRVTASSVKNVDFIDADYGINARGFVYRSQFENIRMRVAKRKANVENCHHGLNASILSQDNLFTNYTFEPGMRCVHDVTVEGFANGNVFSNGAHTQMRIDHHRAAPYANLFTNLHAEDASIMWNSGGATGRGPHAGIRETFWNITADNKLQKLPPESEYPQMVVVGLKGYSGMQTANRWVEATGDKGATPVALYGSSLEAETATLWNATARTNQTKPPVKRGDYSGSGWVEFNRQVPGAYVEWAIPTVGDEAAAGVQLKVRYANGSKETRPMNLSIDGNFVTTATFAPTGGWDKWASQSVDVGSKTGRFKIRLSTAGKDGPRIDDIFLEY